MKCPKCKSRDINISLNFQGFVSQPTKECNDCSLVWFNDGKNNWILFEKLIDKN